MLFGLKRQARAAALRKQIARDNLEAAIAVKALESRIDPGNPNNNRRRTVAAERKSEDARLTVRDRYKGANVGRELHRNDSVMRVFEQQLAINVVGPGPKLTLHWDDKDGAKKAAKWFNEVWACDCDARDDNHLADFCDTALLTVIREGECLCVFDSFDANDGKLTWYESDQLPSLSDEKWKVWAVDPERKGLFVELDRNGDPMKDADGNPVPMKLLQGRVLNRFGRVVYYVADEQHGRQDVDPADAQIRFLSRKVARLLKAPWRFNQLIGQGEVMPLAGDIEDLDAMRSAEIASARKNAQRAYIVKGHDAYEQELARAGIDVDDEIENAESDPEPGQSPTAPNLTALEKFADGYAEYVGENVSVDELGINRPNINVQTFHEDVGGSAGATLGLARVHATLKASTAYTAFRGEMLMSWGMFVRRQKWLERRLLDWLAEKAIAWAVANRKLSVTLPAGWEYGCSWSFPQMPEVDEERTVAARARRLKNALTDYGVELGPDWEERISAFGEQLAVIRKLVPELEIFETKAGAPTKTAQSTKDGSEP